MCEFVLTNKIIRPMQLYIYLKSKCSGAMKISTSDLHNIASDLDLKSSRTIRNNLHILLKLNWIGYDLKQKVFYVRGFETIRKLQGFIGRTSAEFDVRQILRFKGFIVAAVITTLIGEQKRKEWLRERNEGRSNQRNHSPSHSVKFYPIANMVLSKIYKISLSTAFEWKCQAEADGFIIIRKNFESTGINPQRRLMFKLAYPDDLPKIRVLNNYITLQQPDTILSRVRLKRRKKIETYCKGNKASP